MKSLNTLLAATLLFVAIPVAAEEETSSDSIVTVAEQYLAAYSTFDPENMAPFYADDVVFADPTSSDQATNGQGFAFQGKAAVINGLGDYASQFKDFYLNYDLERRYESNSVVVFVAQVTYTVLSNTDQTFTGTAPIVTAVTIEDGKVVRHTDFYDYAGNAKDFE